MTHSPLAIARRHVLGDLYSRCDMIESIPVYLDSTPGERLGYVDESLGHYADAFIFHLPEDFCKKLSSGHFTYSFEYDLSENEAKVDGKHRVKLNSIVLSARPGYTNPLPSRRTASMPAETVETESAG